MCGIVAYIGPKKCNPDDLKILMLANMWRGTDATGYFTPELGINRSCDRVDDFFAKNEIVGTKLFIGHVRKSTYITSDKKAHPFDIDNIIGVHNGTLTSYLALEGSKYGDLELPKNHIDSEFLLGALNQDCEILKSYDGAAALVWYDKRHPNILNFYHDSLRPLFRGKKNGGMFLSSTEESLKIIGCINIKKVNECVVYAADFHHIILSQCRQIKRSPWKPEPSTRVIGYNQPNKTLLQQKDLIEIFDMDRFIKKFNNWCIFDPKKSIFSGISDESVYVGQYVIKIKRLPDTKNWICFSPSTATYEIVNIDALEAIPLLKDTYCYLMDNSNWDIEPNKVAFVEDVIENNEGRVYIVNVYDFHEEKVGENTEYIISSNGEREEFLGIQLLPIFDQDEICKFKTNFDSIETNLYKNELE